MSEPRVLKQLTQPLLEQIHPSLRDSFTALPPLGTRLTEEQLCAVFGGDLRALRDLWLLSSRAGNVVEAPVTHG